MQYEMLNLRRFFRNRFEYYVDHGDAACAGVLDGVFLTLRDLCEILANDDEPFPRNYDRDMRKLCRHEYLIWFRAARNYGDVARILSRLLAAEDAGARGPSGLWVTDALRQNARRR
ncbi:hypothetical protein CN172_01050 [Sinorhizobium meliloti]|uniref:hypothetical protein n=1 Tax=Rhizobium meliloti TaxID=382 RepID=UPI000FD9F524|nr:hypothetical protein [Sinorhizobium meliloti]RVE99710.1 hypothetical protein CN232_16455 [Sinorhizobium meliloti]RVH42641.1 hypothetical protein CN208_17730 [Sinorhizobium meliloti]RVK21657.1 hypothetical protein CN172_01050 [Sinorhizobium meliloti]